MRKHRKNEEGTKFYILIAYENSAKVFATYSDVSFATIQKIKKIIEAEEMKKCGGAIGRTS